MCSSDLCSIIVDGENMSKKLNRPDLVAISGTGAQAKIFLAQGADWPDIVGVAVSSQRDDKWRQVQIKRV